MRSKLSHASHLLLYGEESRAAKVNDLDARLVGLLEQYVFGLEVTVNDLEHLEVLQRVQ